MKIRHRIILWIVGTGLLFSGVVFFEMLEQPYELLDSQIDRRADIPLRHREGGYPVRLRIPSNQGGELARYLDADDDKGLSDEIALRMKEREIVIDALTYRIQLALPMVKLDEEIRELIGALVLGMVLSTLLLAVLSTYVSGRILKPVNQINRLAHEINEKTLRQRIPLGRSRDERYELSRSLNHMFDRLQFSFDQQKQFLASASHHLKSPISILRLFMEQTVQRQDLPESLREDLAEQQRLLMGMNRLVKTLLTLSALEISHKLHLEKFSFRALIESVTRDYDGAIASKKLRLGLSLSGTLTIRGDRDKLRRLLVNVVDNAIKYNNEAGEIRIEASEKAGMITLSVFNTGTGVPREELERVFEAFYRVEKSRAQRYGGTGLGLSIARQIVRLHRGRIIMESQSNV